MPDSPEIRLHSTKWGLYHPHPNAETAWTVHDTRGYMDCSVPCDECGRCGCDERKGPCPDCKSTDKHCECDQGDNCVGLSFAYLCLDGGDFLCEECAQKLGIQVDKCDCP